MVDVEKVKDALRRCAVTEECCGCYAGGKHCYQILMRDALAVIEAQQAHIDDLHKGIEELREWVKDGNV